jgi:putative oxidoreductase
MRATHLIGRILFGGYFLYNGINHFRNRAGLAQYAGAKQVPKPDLAVEASGVLLAFGGTSVLTGWQPKLGAAALIAFLAGVSPVMHDFWRNEDPGQRQTDMINFTKNMALIGAALSLMGTEEPWPFSLSAKKRSFVGRAVESARSLIPV